MTVEYEIQRQDEDGNWVAMEPLTEFHHNRRLIEHVNPLNPPGAYGGQTIKAATEAGPVPAGTVVRIQARTIGEWWTVATGPVDDIDTVHAEETT